MFIQGMDQLFVLVAVVSVNLIVAAAHRCERIKIDNGYYKRQLIATIDGYPSAIVVDPITENIYFRLHKKNYTKGLHVIKHGALGIKPIPISDEFIGQCVGIDEATDTIYIGTNQGLMIYDSAKNELSSDRPIGDDDIRNIFFDRKDNQMYITVGHFHDIYKFVNGSAAVKRFDRIPKAYSFVLDTMGNVFYEYVDGKLYFFSTDYYEPIQYKGFTKDLKYMLHLNNHDVAFVAVKDSVFKLGTDNILPKKILDLNFKITGICYDKKNNIIVGTKGKIYRFNQVDGNDPCPPDDYFMSSI